MIRLDIGFTGSRKGMTWGQMQAVFDILIRHSGGWFHHGDCEESDHISHGIAREAGWSIGLHPPIDDRQRAFCEGDLVWPLKPFLDRNRDIVDVTMGLIAVPGGFEEELRSGTWSTVRYARRLGRPIKIVWPDGSVKEEPARG